MISVFDRVFEPRVPKTTGPKNFRAFGAKTTGPKMKTTGPKKSVSKASKKILVRKLIF